MTISYNWLHEFLPQTIEPEQLSRILTSIGLEVESLEKYERVKGGLAGLVIGEVLECVQHPNADKLKLTRVNTGGAEPLHIVCGASNVAAGQKVVVAPIGVTIYPVNGSPLTMEKRKIRGEESQGMICAEDEIGLGTDHAGILVMPADAVPGDPAVKYFDTYSDWIYEIGLTPNRMDAMSHYGVARDVCAWLTHHQAPAAPKAPAGDAFATDNNDLAIQVTVENTDACPRYSGVSISGVTVQESPQWLKDRLLAIGQRPINNIVDITNYILHETGQPLHAFDADKIDGGHVIVKNLPEGTPFITLDEKERKLGAEDLMICDGNGKGMCIAGVFGGAESGVSSNTSKIFLESACFNPVSIRKTSVRHELRTDAATRFEKGVDISQTVNVLKRAAMLIKSVAGGTISSPIVDIYPAPKTKTAVSLTYSYLRKLSGKSYEASAVKHILEALGFDITGSDEAGITVAVPYSKPDISIPADIVEEVLRIDGLDNIAIPTTITISPAVEELGAKEALKNKIAEYLVGQGFVEILTNSITNSKYFGEEVLGRTVKMLNNLSADLDVLRPSMVETGLEAIAYNINRKNTNLRFFEFGKIYGQSAPGNYFEQEKLCVYLTGADHEDSWNEKSREADFYRLKGIANAIFQLCGLQDAAFDKTENPGELTISYKRRQLGTVMQVAGKKQKDFDIRQPVFILEIDVAALLQAVLQLRITYREVNRFPVMQRDLALVLASDTAYEQVEGAVKKAKLPKLTSMRLFDVFESDKLGAGKKSLAISFTFSDEEKTLTDKEVDAMIGKLVQLFEKELGAEIRK